MGWADWFPWVVLGVLAVVAQVWTPRKSNANHEQALRMIAWLGEQENGDDGTQR